MTKTLFLSLYFYPSAFTGGCNFQAHGFAEAHGSR